MIDTFDNNIYIVMFHYVREIKKSKFPNIKGLEFSDFKDQILYFKKNFNLLSNNQLIEIIDSKKVPKKKSILLTFDDGYKDHIQYVFPFLKKHKISANFYPPIISSQNKKILDVNKIHFILEKEQNKKKILDLIFIYVKKFLNKNPEQIGINKINLKNRYDEKETILIKRLLQDCLPEPHRVKIVAKLFSDIVNVDEEEFSKTLYMNKFDLIELYNNGFKIGSHGNNHFWSENLDKDSQEKELKLSIEYFKNIGVLDEFFSICYPYGSYNLETFPILEKYKIKFGLTTKVGSVNNNNIRNTFELPRFDTNDFI